MVGILKSSNLVVRSRFEKIKTFESIYTGGRICITKDERLLISTLEEDVMITDLETGAEIFRLQPEARAITCLAVCEELLFVGTQSNLLFLYNLSTGEIHNQWKAHDAPVASAAFDERGTLLATGSADSTIRVWDIKGGFCTHNFRGHGGLVATLAFQPVSTQDKIWRLASASEDCTVRIWNLNTKTCDSILQGHSSVVTSLSFVEKGETLVSSGRDGIIHVWDTVKYSSLRTIPTYEQLEASCVFSDSTTGKTLIITGGSLGLVKVYDFETGDLVDTQKALSSSEEKLDVEEQQSDTEGDPDVMESKQIVGLLLLPQKNWVVSITAEQNLYVFGIPDLQLQRQVAGHFDEVIDLCFVGGLFPFRSRHDKSATAEASDYKSVLPDRIDEPTAEERFLAVATNSSSVRLFDIWSSRSTLIHYHSDIVLALARSSDGKRLVTAGKDRRAVLWDVSITEDSQLEATPVAVCSGHTEAIGAVAYSKSGAFIVTASQDRTVKIWDSSDLEVGALQKLQAKSTFLAHSKDINALAVSPDDRIIATASQDKSAKLWNSDSGELYLELVGHKRGVWSVAFSPIDKVLATGSGDQTVKLWSLKDGSCLKTFEGHTNSVLRVSFYNQGLQVLSVGGDGLSKVWNVKTSECVATIDAHEDKIWALAVSRATRQSLRVGRENLHDEPGAEETIVTGGADACVCVWRDVTAEKMLEEQKEHELMVRKEQQLRNCWTAGNFKRAVELSLEMGRPGALGGLLLNILEQRSSARLSEIALKDSVPVDCLIEGPLDFAALQKRQLDDVATIGGVFVSLAPENIAQVMEWVKKWNTQRKYIPVAQWILSVYLKNLKPESWLALPNVSNFFSAVIPYTQKHFQHMEQMLTRSYLIDMTLENMDTLYPSSESIAAAENSSN